MTRTRARMCTGKVRHPDRAAATEAMMRLVQRGAADTGLNVYRCDHCGSWHLGHVGRRR